MKTENNNRTLFGAPIGSFIQRLKVLDNQIEIQVRQWIDWLEDVKRKTYG